MRTHETFHTERTSVPISPYQKTTSRK